MDPASHACHGMWLMISQGVPFTLRMVLKRTTSLSTTWRLLFISSRHLAITRMEGAREESHCLAHHQGSCPQMQQLWDFIAQTRRTAGSVMPPVAVLQVSISQKCLLPS